jgi:hypothetical protein
MPKKEAAHPPPHKASVQSDPFLSYRRSSAFIGGHIVLLRVSPHRYPKFSKLILIFQVRISPNAAGGCACEFESCRAPK